LGLLTKTLILTGRSLMTKRGLGAVCQLSGQQALCLTQEGSQVLSVLVCFKLLLAALRPLDSLLYLIDSLFQPITFAIE
jgi:hypothetical protein